MLGASLAINTLILVDYHKGAVKMDVLAFTSTLALGFINGMICAVPFTLVLCYLHNARKRSLRPRSALYALLIGFFPMIAAAASVPITAGRGHLLLAIPLFLFFLPALCAGALVARPTPIVRHLTEPFSLPNQEQSSELAPGTI